MVKRLQTIPHDWLLNIATLRNDSDVESFQAAFSLISDIEQPIITQGLQIAEILFGLQLDSEIIAAAIIFPALKSNFIHLDQVTDTLGVSINQLLRDALQMQSLGKLHHLRVRDPHQIERLRKMLLAMVTDIRAVLLVLAERLWQLHEIKSASKDMQKQLAQETLDVYAPLANRLGVWQMKWEIEDLSFRYLEPNQYNHIAQWLAARREQREIYLQNMVQLVTEQLTKASLRHFKVTGRVKHIYSIYRKMQRKDANINTIYDISALRVLVPELADCYTVLGLLHDTWEHVLDEFDDYISQPKANGYRSLHTVLIGPTQHFVEVQIRTYQMNEESELGLAAHWQYKEGFKPGPYDTKIALLRQIMAWQHEVTRLADEKNTIAAQDLFADHVYVFTPMGDIIDLPQGATPLDFAYHVHSEVGHRCRGAKVNGNMVSLSYPLQTGDRVEILTAKVANPSRDWLNPQLNYLKTSRAQAKVQHWFRMRDRLQTILAGRGLLERELKKQGLNPKIDLASLAAHFDYKNSEALLMAIAAGNLRISQIINYLHPQPVNQDPFVQRELTTESSHQVQILGVNNLLTNLARCCKALPDDPIIGFITRTRGVSVHRQDCQNLVSINQTHKPRLIPVNWSNKISGCYQVDLYLQVQNRTGLLRDITALLANESINVMSLQTHQKSASESCDIYVTVEINDRTQLQKALLSLQNIPNILMAKRR